MANLQEVKIVNQNNGSEVFFFKHSFKSAKQHAEEYCERNKGKFPMKVYTRTSKPLPAPLWEFYKEV